jgi:hypothetical protein
MIPLGPRYPDNINQTITISECIERFIMQVMTLVRTPLIK